jgi:hypothetical protein
LEAAVDRAEPRFLAEDLIVPDFFEGRFADFDLSLLVAI